MAHFAQLDDSNTVTQVIVVGNNDLLVDGVEQESKGIEFCKSLLGQSTIWKQTSYNGNFRKHYAGIGFTYDSTLNAFIPPKPYASWVLDTETCNWNAPTAYPNDDKIYMWDEPTLTWKE
jgi:hypothetical protein